MPITAVVTSDNHLGAVHARMRPERQERRRRALQAGLRRVVDLALERRVDLFLHCGDLFDRPDARNADRLFAAQQLRRLRDAGIHVFAIAGNHDRPRNPGHDGGVAAQEELAALGGAHLFRGSDHLESASVSVRGTRVSVWGMSSDFCRPPDSCPLDAMDPPEGEEADVRVALLHYSVEGWGRPDSPEPRLSLSNLSRLPADALCVGHLHSPNLRRLPTGALLLNPGATEHLTFGEEGRPCGCWLLSLEPGRAEAEYLPIPSQPLRTLTLDLTDGTAPQDLLAHIEDPELLLRVRLTGRIPRERFQEMDLPALEAWAAERCFYCQLDTSDLVVCDPLEALPAGGYGMSFDVAAELRAFTDAFLEECGEDEQLREVTRLAGERAVEGYLRLTGGAR